MPKIKHQGKVLEGDFSNCPVYVYLDSECVITKNFVEKGFGAAKTEILVVISPKTVEKHVILSSVDIVLHFKDGKKCKIRTLGKQITDAIVSDLFVL